MNAIIRTGCAADVPLLAAIELAAGELFPAARIPDPDVLFPVALLEKAGAEDLLFVADVVGRVVGFATSTIVTDRLHLDELSVHPEFGRQGLGRRLVQAVVDAAHDRGLCGVSLTTFADIPWNGPFYQSMGFTILAEDALDEPLTAALTYERELGLTERIAMFRPAQEIAQ